MQVWIVTFTVGDQRAGQIVAICASLKTAQAKARDEMTEYEEQGYRWTPLPVTRTHSGAYARGWQAGDNAYTVRIVERTVDE